MTLKLRHVPQDPVPNRDLGPGLAASTTTISGWLSMLARMLPRAQAESIRDELETHLSDRVRDLMVGGVDENEATKRAIAELGEAADMAAKYRALQTEPRRRLVMYGSIFGVCGAALALSIAAISGGRVPAQPVQPREPGVPMLREVPVISSLFKQPEARYQLWLEPTFVARVVPEDFESLTFDVDFENAPVSDVLEFVGKAVKLPVHTRWDQLQELNIQKDSPITLRAKKAGAATVLRALNEVTEVGKSPISWRVNNGVLEVGATQFFDRREIKLTIYDLSAIVRARLETYHEDRGPVVEEIVNLLREFVSAEGWRDNGGDLAKMTIVGDRLFVEAPERFHKQIKWILDQLPTGGAGNGGDGGGKPRGQAAPHSVQTYAIKHISADELVNRLGDVAGSDVAKGQTILADPRTNSVIVTGAEARQKQVGEIIAMLDVAAGNQNESSKQEAMQSFPLRVMDAEATRVLLTRVFDIVPGLRQCKIERTLLASTNTNSVVLRATQDQVDVVAKLIDMIDRPAPAQVRGAEAARQFKLRHIAPTELREFLAMVVNQSPALKECAVARTMECNDSTGQFGLTATEDQVDVVARLIALVDRPASEH